MMLNLLLRIKIELNYRAKLNFNVLEIYNISLNKYMEKVLKNREIPNCNH